MTWPQLGRRLSPNSTSAATSVSDSASVHAEHYQPLEDIFLGCRHCAMCLMRWSCLRFAVGWIRLDCKRILSPLLTSVMLTVMPPRLRFRYFCPPLSLSLSLLPNLVDGLESKNTSGRGCLFLTIIFIFSLKYFLLPITALHNHRARERKDHKIFIPTAAIPAPPPSWIFILWILIKEEVASEHKQ